MPGIYDTHLECVMVARTSDSQGPHASDHYAAMAQTSVQRVSHEHALVFLIFALAEYADAEKKKHGVSIRENSAVRSHWESVGRGLLGLLANGDPGRLDRPTVDRLVRDMLEGEGLRRE